MRLAPAAIRHHGDHERAIDVARRQSLTTHAAPTAVDACAFFAGVLVDAINGTDRQALLSSRRFEGHPEIAAIADGHYRAKVRRAIASSGYVVHTLEAALWCVHGAADFCDAVLVAANLGNDKTRDVPGRSGPGLRAHRPLAGFEPLCTVLES
jgi:ADP-ribosyl-[dinitrogen reductase] hydrolase